jgi:copper(I)-binding protein
MTLLRRLLVAFALVAALAACGGDTATSADLEFTDVWTRQPAAGQPNAAVYGTVTNTGGTDVTITGASVEISDRVELHEVLMDDGLMTMQERDGGFVVPAGGSITLEPGGLHVMVFGIDADTYPTDALDVTFSFDSGEPTFASAEVRAIDGDSMSDMDHSDMDHSDMEMDDMDHSDMEMEDMDGMDEMEMEETDG